MTREEAIHFAECLKNNWTVNLANVEEFYDMAIEALKADAVHKPDYSYEADMVRRLKEATSAEAEWIPCSERLPETHTEYVTENPWMQVSITEETYQLSEPVLGYGKRKHHDDDDPMMAVVWYEDGGYGRTAWTTAPDCEDIDILAWMPLPKPYREDGEV